MNDDDSQLLARLTRACGEFRGTEQQFGRLMRQQVRPLLDFSFAVAAIGPSVGTSVLPVRIIGVDAPPRLMRAMGLAARLVRSPDALSTVAARSPTVVDSKRASSRELAHPYLWSLRGARVAFDSHLDQSHGLRSYFAFAGFNTCGNDAVGPLLRSIIPLLHSALSQLQVRPELLLAPVLFTTAERAVITHLLRYKSNKEWS